MLDILGITGPIYLAIVVGYGATRAGWFSAEDMRVLGRFVIQLALPALLFIALSQRPWREVFHGPYLLAYALASLGTVLLGLLWSRGSQKQGLSHSAVMAMGMACPNSGFVGYPVVLLTLGAPVAGVALALNMIVENLLIIPLLLALAEMGRGSGQRWLPVLRQTLGGLVRNPMIIGIALGAAASVLGWRLPEAAARTVQLFAQSSAALSLFVIGGSLVGLGGQRLWPAVARIGIGKLLLHPLLMLAVLTWLLPLDDPGLRTALLLTTAMPMLGIYTILAQRHGLQALSSAALLATTAASFFTLSALLWLLHAVHWL